MVHRGTRHFSHFSRHFRDTLDTFLDTKKSMLLFCHEIANVFPKRLFLNLNIIFMNNVNKVNILNICFILLLLHWLGIGSGLT